MVGSIVDSKTYQDLVHYFKYASSTYITPICPRPNGNTLVLNFSNSITDIQGFVARDSNRKEIIVAIRGSLSIVDFLMDSQIMLVPFTSPGVSAPCKSNLRQVTDLLVIQQISRHPCAQRFSSRLEFNSRPSLHHLVSATQVASRILYRYYRSFVGRLSFFAGISSFET